MDRRTLIPGIVVARLSKDARTSLKRPGASDVLFLGCSGLSDDPNELLGCEALGAQERLDYLPSWPRLGRHEGEVGGSSWVGGGGAWGPLGGQAQAPANYRAKH